MILLLLFAAALSVQAQQNPCASEPYLQRDSLLGERQTASGPVRYRKAVHGCAIVEDRVDSKALHFYDPAAQNWRTVRVSLGGRVTDIRNEPLPDKTAPPRAPAAPPTCTHREFDFWLGRWNVYTPRGAQAGTNHIYSAVGGCLLVENWTNSTLGSGISFNFWDPQRKAWRQVWVAPGSILDVEGQVEGGVLRYRNPSARMSFTPNLDGSVRQYWEQSADGGRTWAASFDGTYRRAAEGELAPLLADLAASAAATPASLPATVLHRLLEFEKFTAAAVRKLLAAPATSNPSGFEAGIIEPLLGSMIANRNIRLSIPAPSSPPSLSAPELHAALLHDRAETIALARSASLRGAREMHALGGPALDAFQWLYVLAAHHRRLLDPAPSFTPPSLRTWSGHWTGDGTFQGRPARLELDLDPTLGGKFDELRAAVVQNGRRIFEGRALYAADLTASWADSAGNAYPVKGRLAENRLVSEWGGDPVRGRSTYAVDPASGEMEVIDEVKRPDGNFAVFARYRVTRAAADSTQFWQLGNLSGRQAASGRPELPVFESGSVSVVLVGLDASSAAQPPTRADRDQLYVVETGQVVLNAGQQRIPLQPGSVAFVAQGVPRHFEPTLDTVKVLVIAAKP